MIDKIERLFDELLIIMQEEELNDAYFHLLYERDDIYKKLIIRNKDIIPNIAKVMLLRN